MNKKSTISDLTNVNFCLFLDHKISYTSNEMWIVILVDYYM